MVDILLLEDDKVLSKEIRSFLLNQGFSCDQAFDGIEFLAKTHQKKYDFYLLDINVPKINGLEICQKIRSHDALIPIIILSAYDDIDDKKEAFLRAADDYLVKPFILDELVMRIHSLLRRQQYSENDDSKTLIIDDLIIYPADARVLRANEEINLTQKEFQLLLILAQAKGRTLSKQHISEEVWQNQFQTTQNTIEVYINFLRKKIDKNFENKLIHTRPGFGYYLSANK
ncbi:response regulator transcription factor [Sphingobacterium sp. 2149]|uniref:response regulator transcription factor n=1 Tax=Sphingobacterium sp. 2149 TaxID=2817763 RepID=UPI00285E353E|nr:response regulator transcription factor [Sphingobacterium sp. 2149]MDR6737801.1 DNA-binding response OmpR family regulator [Sphingobacterium sp. 2149]